MSLLPNKIWAADGYINGVVGGFWSPDEDADETPYLRLDGPTLQAVREAMTLARRVVASKHEHKLLSDAIKLLEGK